MLETISVSLNLYLKASRLVYNMVKGIFTYQDNFHLISYPYLFTRGTNMDFNSLNNIHNCRYLKSNSIRPPVEKNCIP